VPERNYAFVPKIVLAASGSNTVTLDAEGGYFEVVKVETRLFGGGDRVEEFSLDGALAETRSV
jgi:hypothetical protein